MTLKPRSRARSGMKSWGCARVAKHDGNQGFHPETSRLSDRRQATKSNTSRSSRREQEERVPLGAIIEEKLKICGAARRPSD